MSATESFEGKGGIGPASRFDRIEEWQCEHEEKDEKRHGEVMGKLQDVDRDRWRTEGRYQVGQIVVILITLVGTLVSIYAVFAK